MACSTLRQKTVMKLCMVAGAAVPITEVPSSCKKKPASYEMYTISPPAESSFEEWVDQQIAEFEREYGVAVCGPELIVPIEEFQSVPNALREWSIENSGSRRTVVFKGKNNDFVFKGGRPYCLSRGNPYFTESISVPPRVAKDLGLIEEGEALPVWMCFLTTDDHFLRSFDQRYGKGVEMGSGVTEKLLSGLLNWNLKPHYREIDLKLMRLQRREALWAALLQACSGGQETTVKLRKLRDRTDRECVKIFLSRRTT